MSESGARGGCHPHRPEGGGDTERRVRGGRHARGERTHVASGGEVLEFMLVVAAASGTRVGHGG